MSAYLEFVIPPPFDTLIAWQLWIAEQRAFPNQPVTVQSGEAEVVIQFVTQLGSATGRGSIRGRVAVPDRSDVRLYVPLETLRGAAARAMLPPDRDTARPRHSAINPPFAAKERSTSVNPTGP